MFLPRVRKDNLFSLVSLRELEPLGLSPADLAGYRALIAHVQMEPVFGGRDVLVDLAHLLADPEAPVRVSAAHAVAVAGGDASIPLLHLKAVAGLPRVMI